MIIYVKIILKEGENMDIDLQQLLSSFLEDGCIIANKIYSLKEIGESGLDGFSEKFHSKSNFKLYKYCPNTIDTNTKRNYSVENLINNTVYMQDSKIFDDSFDCAIDIDINIFTKLRFQKYCEYFKLEFSEDDDLSKLAYKIRCFLYDYFKDNKLESFIEEFTDPIQKLTIQNFIANIKVEIEVNHLEFNSALSEVINKEYNTYINRLNLFKITCFSMSPYINRMWSSNYGDNNRGFCIEYTIDIDDEDKRELFENLYPVIYSQKRSDNLIFMQENDVILSENGVWQYYYNGMLRKSFSWLDQMEWRLILPKKHIKKDNLVNFYKITKVYLGIKMPKEERGKIIDICKKFDIPYEGVVRKTDSFDIVSCKGDCYNCVKNK